MVVILLVMMWAMEVKAEVVEVAVEVVAEVKR